jgi:hypothetical protein
MLEEAKIAIEIMYAGSIYENQIETFWGVEMVGNSTDGSRFDSSRETEELL